MSWNKKHPTDAHVQKKEKNREDKQRQGIKRGENNQRKENERKRKGRGGLGRHILLRKWSPVRDPLRGQGQGQKQVQLSRHKTRHRMKRLQTREKRTNMHTKVPRKGKLKIPRFRILSLRVRYFSSLFVFRMRTWRRVLHMGGVGFWRFGRLYFIGLCLLRIIENWHLALGNW